MTMNDGYDNTCKVIITQKAEQFTLCRIGAHMGKVQAAFLQVESFANILRDLRQSLMH